MEFKPGNAVWVKWHRHTWPALVVSKEETPHEYKGTKKMIFIKFLTQKVYAAKKSNSFMKPFNGADTETYSKRGANIQNPELKLLFHCDLCAIREYIKNHHTDETGPKIVRSRSESPTVDELCIFPPPTAWEGVATSPTKTTFRRRTWPLSRQTPLKRKPAVHPSASGFAHQSAAPTSTTNSRATTRTRNTVSGKRRRKKRCDSVTQTIKRSKLRDSAIVSDDKSKPCDSDIASFKKPCDSTHTRVKMPKLEPLPLEDTEVFTSTYLDLNETYSMLDHLDSSDSDTEELPVFSLSQSTKEDDIRVGELVWVRYRSQLFWPSVVRVVYKKKKKIKKVTVTFLDHFNTPECQNARIKSYRVMYTKKRVIPFGVSYEQHSEFKKKGLESAESASFEAAVDRAEAFITKRGATRDTNFNVFQYFSNELSLNNLAADSDNQIPSDSVISTELPFSGLHDMDSDSQESPTESDNQADSDSQSEERLHKDEPVKRILTSAEQKMSRKRIERGAKIVEYINTEKTKKRLVDIYEGRLKCRRHDLFYKVDKTAAEKLELENQGCGPITDDEQEEKMVHTLMSCFKSVSPEANCLNGVKYVLDVWVPEAIIYVTATIGRTSFAAAEKRFLSGVRWTKAEKTEQRNDTIRNAENITEEDREIYRLRRERNLQKLGLAPIVQT